MRSAKAFSESQMREGIETALEKWFYQTASIWPLLTVPPVS